jgi:electron transfer flavoprotein alpha subunit
MHIIVLVKQVPETEEMRYDPATRTLVRQGVTLVINPYDKRALTEAMRLRALYGGTVTAITMGPPQARQALVECVGRGVDRAIHITDPVFAGSDTLVTSRTLAVALKRLRFDLLLLGKVATDSETGQVGPELAELLDLPQITGATAIEPSDERTLWVTRETDYGFERMECPLPALLTAAERLIKPVKTTPQIIEEGMRRVQSDPRLIETWDAHELGIQREEAGLSGSPTWVAGLRPVKIERARTMLTGHPVSVADELLRELERRGLRLSRGVSRPAPALPAPPAHPSPDRKVWAVAECLPAFDGSIRLRRVSLELAGEAARLASLVGGQSQVVLIGNGVKPLAEHLARHGAEQVLLAEAPELGVYSTETYAHLLANAIRAAAPWAVLLPATSFGRDLAPRVAARLGLGLTADCLGFEVDREGRLVQLKPAFGGQVVALILSRTLPQMATVRPGVLPVYAPDPSRPVRVELIRPGGLPEPRTTVVEVNREGEAGLALDDARLVVCVGTGTGGPHALPVVHRLADALGRWMGLSQDEVAIGGTRRVVDEGWLPRQQQIGITGRAVAPDLYLGLGVSGKFNHMAGIMRAGTIAALNKDPDAPIFGAADIGMVAGWQPVAEALIERLEELNP